MTEATEVDVNARRGRPRPQNTIERDETVYRVLREFDGPVTRNQLAEKLSMQSSHVYLSLIRLRRDGHVQRGATNGTWEAVAR